MADFKYLHELYAKPIDRSFNPAVNASDFNAETVKVEINEYVFTDEIINSLYDVLSNVRDRRTAHNGIWINGYFGSGKSHFLKFLDYCLHPEYSADALYRLAEAVKEHDPLLNPSSNCKVTVEEINSLVAWLSGAQAETILFNIGSVANSNTGAQKVFTEVFWHEFNRRRGYNYFSLPLAQYLEKVLDEKEKFDEFKQKLFDEFGWDWNEIAAELANTELDTILEVAKDVVPTLSIDVIRQRIVKNEFPLTVEAFMKELRSYVASKPDNFRLVFFADEISQFIDNRSALLLQLQQIVSDLHEACEGKVWIACTAQQDLSEILGDCHISKTTDDYGKIMGRFQVKVSLKGTNTEYITQKRILEKKGSASIALENTFDKIRGNITAQLLFPTGYNTFRDKEEYAAYYPFIPYQFMLMMNIFDAFVAQGFVDKEVKGNERSIIKITHSVANQTKDQEVGNLISFDQFYNAMFRGSLTNKGQKAIATANSIIENYSPNRELGQKVVNVLFMICNMDEQQRRVFPATIDYVTSLLMRNVDENKQRLKNDVQSVVDYLVDNNILRRDTLADGKTEVYAFFTEEERRVASSIGNQYVDNDFMANQLIDFIRDYLAPQNRESFCSSKFSIGGIVNGKTFLTSNPDISVEFVLETDATVHEYAFRNLRNRLAFFMADRFAADPQLRNRLTWVCKVRKFLQSPDGQSTSDTRKAALDKFRQMANDEAKEIEKLLKDLFNSAYVISGQQQLTVASSTKDKDRYTEALTRHLQNVYAYAKIANGSDVPKTEADLKAKIMRPSLKDEYTNNPVTAPETEIENYLRRHGGEANLKDIVKDFAAAPYGWSEYATIYFINELVRRNLREFTYNNAENPERATVAANVIRDTAKFMVKTTKEIPQTIINDFLDSWHDVFGDASSPATSHPADIHSWAKGVLNRVIGNDKDAVSRLGGFDSPVATRMKQADDILESWLMVRDDEHFFRRVATDRATAKKLMDDAKQIRQFADNDTMLRGYKDFIAFVKENAENFTSLPDTYRTDIDGLKAILTESWPINKMRHYKQMKQTLSKTIDDVRLELKRRIEEKLRGQLKELLAHAASVNVDYTPNVESAITRLTITSNILTLKANEMSNDWYTDEIKAINSRIKGAPVKKIKGVRLKTPSLSNIKDARDVETYLDGLRKQLLNHLANLDSGDEIQVL